MSAKAERIIVGIGFLSALILALSFALPLTEYTTYVDADGKPVGFLGQLFPEPDSNRVTTFGYFWEDIDWVVPVVFFFPGILIAVRQWSAGRLRAVLTAIVPIVAALLLVPLLAMVWFADFAILPGMGGERAYGGYVAVGALGCFLIATSLLAATSIRRVRSTGRANPTLVCS